MTKLGFAAVNALGVALLLHASGCDDTKNEVSLVPGADDASVSAATAVEATADGGQPPSVPQGDRSMASLDGGGMDAGALDARAPAAPSSDGGADSAIVEATDAASSGNPDAATGDTDAAVIVAGDGPSMDMLFVIDNSGSMASKQAKLTMQLPRLVNMLTSGDRCAGLAPAACTYTDTSTPPRRFTAVKSLHLGVVTSNAGGIDDPPSNQVAILSCKGTGDDGKLQNSTDIAANGVIATRNEFQGKNAGDVVVEPDPNCSGLGSVPRYQEYEASDPSSAASSEKNFGCVAQVGVRGCPFEQHLESAWKALAPSVGQGDLYQFLNGSTGQGDQYNKGFLRDDAILAVVVLGDEDDCAITDAGKVMFITGGAAGAQADAEYGALNLRCGLNYKRADLVRPTQRYVDGLRSLKPGHPDRIIFAAITGVPQAALRNKLSLDDILALPEMQFSESPASPGFPTPSCSNTAGSEIAYPGIRHAEVVKGFGDQGILYSICEDDYAPVIDSLVERAAPKLHP